MKTDYNGSIYEVNIRQYTPEGTFKAFLPHIPRLKKLGIETLWFMPIYPIGVTNRKGTLGSYYSISDYTDVNPEFGTLKDFKQVVKKAHASGMKVMLDMVANHTSWDHIWLKQNHIFWYERTEQGEIISPYDWSDTAKLNYRNPKLRRAMIDVMIFWIKEVGIDGYRQDMAGLVPLDFWQQAIHELREIKPDIFMLGEVEDAEYHMHNTFDATYSWELCHMLEHIAQGAYGASAVRDRLNYEKQIFPPTASRLLFTSNHDENSWSGTEFKRFGDAAKTMAALTFVLNGIPLIYSGQEAGNNKELKFFDKDLIDWSGIKEYTPFYTELNDLRKKCSAINPSGRGADIEYISNSQPENILSFKRKNSKSEIIAIFNLTPYHVQPAFYDEQYCGEWNKLFHSKQTLHSGNYDPFAPWEFKIYYR
ncbi:MAG: alpha-amylase family glycosyl hydrolase [Rikenellaceae bacterium]